MNDNPKNERYLGVLCRSCAIPIPVPQKALTRARASEVENAAGPTEARSSMLNLRCHACEREYCYRLGEVAEMQGTPWSQRSHTGSSTQFLRKQAKLARVAGA
ncbi:MAG TPA: hypothetical protein VMJ93_16510 [Verrucomicrobiae bacterium]|nr:hypothetical protein [Verrucomicrobiae bacterium]